MPKQIWLLVIATTVNVTGASFLWPLNTIYMHNELGKSLAFAGFILMLNQGASIAGNLLGGILFDKFSPYRTILYGTGLAIIASAVMVLFHQDIVVYSISLVFIGFGSGITWPVMFAMAGSIWKEGGRRAFNAIYVAQNFGVALGATLGGYVASISFNYIFISNAVLFFSFFLIVLFTFKPMDSSIDRQMHTTVLKQHGTMKDKTAFVALLILCGGFLVTWIAYSQWQSTIASYTQDLQIPLELYSSLWAINGFLIVLGQPLIKWITKKVTSQKMQIYVGNTIFLISFLIALLSETFSMFAIAMVILTVGEMLVWPAVPTLANDLAPHGRTGFYQGIVNSVGAAGRMVGPVLGGIVVDMFNIELLFFILFALLIIPYITTSIYDRGIALKRKME
ncbi:putative MFS-type transporter YttB [Virgibacillus pantothenticus]|uniref:Multidrug MFS transporter n=1 Tax=Virgibacillus pantothenticus TaxID=1473 RepID=A0A0L0QM96_VIRPA|nr:MULTISPECIES: MFS transporter [Virgibacillus]API93423.1 MFS transporter [Virgibacillus sp. 6R]KNE19740.1 multidrug MFS transporter [Virgibacillus pantothenticus]MBS7430208.1 MFS transporter [Virgibacillus sp. 19R1-5]MBU8566236.1 MFS transporter [Virgibacillus pantothenticus]MBU8600661.1 MFS transporter [Virgibacillus pantothenticus]